MGGSGSGGRLLDEDSLLGLELYHDADCGGGEDRGRGGNEEGLKLSGGTIIGLGDGGREEPLAGGWGEQSRRDEGCDRASEHWTGSRGSEIVGNDEGSEGDGSREVCKRRGDG